MSVKLIEEGNKETRNKGTKQLGEMENEKEQKVRKKQGITKASFP